MLRPGGRLVAFGASSVMSGETRNLLKAAPQALRMVRGFNLMDQMSDSKAVIGLNMLRLWDDRGTLEPWVTPLGEMLEDGTLSPVVHEAVPFDRAPDAHRILGERRNVGKVVLVPVDCPEHDVRARASPASSPPPLGGAIAWRPHCRKPTGTADTSSH